jgi:hypothetical protein
MIQQEVGENCITMSFLTCTVGQIHLELSSKGGQLAGHVAHMEAKMNAYRVLVESQRTETTWKT